MINVERVRRTCGRAIDFLLPPRCGGCRSVGELLCKQCVSKIKWLNDEAICLQCGVPVANSRIRCKGCHSAQYAPTFVRAAVRFEGPITLAIHQFKYLNRFALAEPLANLMIHAWEAFGAELQSDMMVPVSLHAKRLTKRGYNQALLLAKPISVATGISISETALIRRRETPPQARLRGDARRKNIADAFWADRTVIQDQRVLLIDDVCTTGATLHAAEGALMAAGARQVRAYCLARAGQGGA